LTAYLPDRQLRDRVKAALATLTDLDHEIRRSGLRGNADPGRPRARRQRSTRRRQDAPDLPKRKISPHTIGKTFTAPDGKAFPATDVPHPHLPVLRQGARGRHSD
jgi:hypothetical protein